MLGKMAQWTPSVLLVILVFCGSAGARADGEFSIIVNDDDGAPGYIQESGDWNHSAVSADCLGIPNDSSRYTVQAINLGARATFTPVISLEGFYMIEMALPATAAASHHALYEIHYHGGLACDSVWMNQNTDHACDWRELGVYQLSAGTDNSVSVINDGTGSGYVLRADLMRFTFINPVTVISSGNVFPLPQAHALSQNHPNPFNAATEIGYRLPAASRVTLRIFHTLGQEVRVLVDGHQGAGAHTVRWDGRDAGGHEVASGLYFCRMETGGFGKTMKMMLIR
jgi:hypothetical protein